MNNTQFRNKLRRSFAQGPSAQQIDVLRDQQRPIDVDGRRHACQVTVVAGI